MILPKITYRLFLLLFFMSMLNEKSSSQNLESEDLYELSLEELLDIEITSASRSAEKLVDAPGIVQVITQEEIERFGAISLAEVLDRVTGAFNMSSILYSQNVTSSARRFGK